jgi:hypothetical protein
MGTKRASIFAHRPLRIGLMALLTFMGVTGCATDHPEIHPPSVIQKALIGKTKQELLACAGTPIQETVQEDLLVLTYYKEASLLEESFAESKSTLPKAHHGCRARLGLKDDRVEGVEYVPVPNTVKDEEHCDEIFENCLAP